MIAHDEAIINRKRSHCSAFEPASKGCPFAVTSTPDGTGGRVYAIALLATAGDSCAGSVVYFFDGERLITDTSALPPSTTPPMARLNSPAPGRISVVWRVNPAVNTPCYQFGSAGTDTYVYRWNGKTMTLLSGNPPQPPKTFPSWGPTSPPTQQASCPEAGPGVPAGLVAAVKQETQGGNLCGLEIDHVRADPQDPSWIMFGLTPTPGSTAQGGAGIAHEVNGAWPVVHTGSALFWCDPDVPARVVAAFGLTCPQS